MRWKVCAVLVLLVVAGCGNNRAPSAGPPPVGPPVWVQAECPRGTTQDGALDPLRPPPGGEVPADFRAEWVLRCRTQWHPQQGHTVQGVRVAERADLTDQRLVDALRRPSEPPSDGECPAIAYARPHIILVDATGRGLRPAIPSEACGKPATSVDDALAALTFDTVTETPR